MEFMGYEHRGEAVRGEGSGQWKTHTHSVLVIHRVDGASGDDRTRS